MDTKEVDKEILKIRKALHERLEMAGKAAKKALEELNKAIAEYHEAHSNARSESKLLPMEKHEKLLKAITKSQEDLTDGLKIYLEIEEEHKTYFKIGSV